MRNKSGIADNTTVWIFGAVFLVFIFYTSSSNGKLISSEEYGTVSNRVDGKLNPANKKHKHPFPKAYSFFLNSESGEANEIENFEDNDINPFTTDDYDADYAYMFPTNAGTCMSQNYPPDCDVSDINKWVEEAKKDGIYQNYDLRKVWGSKCPSILEISDQGSCNTCWAVTVTDVLTDRLCIFTDGEIKERYSAADVMTCCRWCSSDEPKNICDKQGKHKQVWLRWINVGITSGGFYKDKSGCLSYPIPPCNHNLTSDTSSLKRCSGLYTYNNTCPKVCEGEFPPAKTMLLKGKSCYLLRRDSLDRRVKGEDSVKMEIFKRGPVHAVIKTNLTSYIPGTIHDSSAPDKAHSVRIVGWGEEKGTEGEIHKYWIIANSWGAEWGMDGFFYLAFNYVGEPEVYAGQFEPPGTC